MAASSGIDYSSFPSIMDSIQDASSLSTLVKLRETSKTFVNDKHDMRIKKLLAKHVVLVPVENGEPGQHELRFGGMVPRFLIGGIPLATSGTKYRLDSLPAQLITHVKNLDISTTGYHMDEFPRFPSLNMVRVFRWEPVSRATPVLPKCHTVVIGPEVRDFSITIAPSRVKRIVFMGNAVNGATCSVSFSKPGTVSEVVFVSQVLNGLGRVNLSRGVQNGLMEIAREGVRIGKAVLVDVPSSGEEFDQTLLYFIRHNLRELSALRSLEISRMSWIEYERVSQGYAQGR